jgi:hypothetical protein
MRWKLLIAASLLAALAGVGAVAAVARLVSGEPGGVAGAAAPASLLAPVASIVFASVFVYRHTARRRKAQAMATALLAGVLTLAALLAGSLVSPRAAVEITPTPSPPSGAS